MLDLQPSGLEASVDYLKRRFHANRKYIFWLIFIALLLWVMVRVKEVTSLLVLSYVLALLMDPLVTRLERHRVPRSVSICGFFVMIFLAFIAILAFAVPALLTEYSSLVDVLPGYVREVALKLRAALSRWPSVQRHLNPDQLWNDLNGLSSVVGVEHIKNIAATFSETLLSGYSVTLTILNLTLLPFFVFYIASDLRKIHGFFGSFLPPQPRRQVELVGGDILAHIYTFFRGQLTVACILILFYVSGLLIIGLPWAIVIGVLSGALSVVPYLGVATGMILSLIITLVTTPGWWPVGKVLIVFVTVQSIEGSILTPRIIGTSLGIHPLGVMLALIVGGKLLGLLGLIIAIPAAAAIRVLVKYALERLDSSAGNDPEAIIVTSPS